MPEEIVDPEAPYGRKANGQPYKRDPRPFEHLRGMPFGTKPAAARALKSPGRPPRPRGERRPKDTTPPARSAEEYTGLIAKGAAMVGGGMMGRAGRAADAGLALKLNADELGDALGPVAVSHPRIGRVIDRVVTQGETSRAIGALAQTAAMMARMAGIIPTGHPLARIIDRSITRRIEDMMLTDPDVALFVAQRSTSAGGGEDDTAEPSVFVAAAG